MNDMRTLQAVLGSQAVLDRNQKAIILALFNADGSPFTGEPAGVTGSEVVLTGFVTGAAVTAVAATDTVNAAIAKLQNRIAALEA